MTDSAARAVAILRDSSQFQWTVVPLLLVVVYIYSLEIGHRNWGAVAAGLALWGMDLFNEIGNSLFFHLTGYAPIWGAPGGTSYLLLIGLNIEICLMFALMGLAAVKTLPADPRQKIIGLPNRLLFALVFSGLSVLVESVLNHLGALTWDYSWWSARAPWLIFLLGYLPFFLVAFYVHDLPGKRRKALAVATILSIDGIALLLFGPVLHWI